MPLRSRAIHTVALLGMIAASRPCVAARHDSNPRHAQPAAVAGWAEFPDASPEPVPTAEAAAAGFVVFRRSVLERVYQRSKPHPGEAATAVAVRAALDEYEPAQLAVYALRDVKFAQVSVSDLADAAKHVLPASELSVRMVRYYGARLSIETKKRFGVVPKTLEIAVPVDVPAHTARAYWITVHVPATQAAGTYRGTITVKHSAGETRIPLSVDVLPVTLHEPAVMYGTMGVNALANLWKRPAPASATPGPARGEDLRRQAELMFRDQREHGMTTMSLRSGTRYDERGGNPYLPDLEAAIDLYKRYRFPQPMIYCLGHLLRTNKINRSANYREFDPEVHEPMARKVAAYYTRVAREAGLPGLVFVPVEEPNRRSGIGLFDPADIRERLARDLNRDIKESGGLTGMTCTPDSVRSVAPHLNYWVVAYRRFTPQVYEMAARAGAKMAIYANAAMMGQGTYFTRFLFGYFTWATGIDGMLPWTYHGTPKRFPRNLEDRGEGALNVRDGFVGLDGRPVPTIQWELAREGIDDARYLVTLDALAKQARASGDPAAGRAADEAEAFLAGIRASVDRDVRHYRFQDPATIEPAPQDGWTAEKFDRTRERAAELLRRLSAAPPRPAK